MASTLIVSPLLLLPHPTFAANYGGFSSTYAEVVSPQDAVINKDMLSSDGVKSGFDALEKYRSVIAGLKEDLSKDTNTDLSARIKRDLNIGVVRSQLNKFNALFSEDTQRGTDRLIRNLLQDITELDRTTVIKSGKIRSETKANIIMKRLTAAEDTLTELKAFYPK